MSNTKKIFIVGVAHSGTTILYKMLAYHPDLAWFCQFSQRNGQVPGRKTLPFSDLFKRNIRKWVTHSWKKGVADFWIPRPGEAWSVLEFVFQAGDTEGQKDRLRTIVHNELKSWYKSSIILKNPKLGLNMELVLEAFPRDSFFVHIVRDGRAVILSDLHKFQRQSQKSDALDRAIAYWCQYMEATIRFQKKTGGKNILVLRYEDFIKDIHSHLKMILRLCDCDYSRFDFSRLPISLSSTNPKWINDQNSDMLKIIEPLARKYLRHFEY